MVPTCKYSVFSLLCVVVACCSGKAASTPDGGTPDGTPADSGEAGASTDGATTDSSDAAVSETSAAALEQAVLGSWTHAHEEVSDSQVYYPTESRVWQASWFRQTIEFAAEGQCQRLVLDPADAHFTTPCRWQADGTQADVISVRTPDGDEVAHLRVVETGPSILRLKRLDGPGLSCHDCEFPPPGG